MTQRTSAGGLQVAEVLHQFIEQQALPGTGVSSEVFGRVSASSLPIFRR